MGAVSCARASTHVRLTRKSYQGSGASESRHPNECWIHAFSTGVCWLDSIWY